MQTYQVPDPCCFRRSSRLGLLLCQYMALCVRILWGPRIPVWNRRTGVRMTHGLLVCSRPSHRESKIESWCQPGNSSVGRSRLVGLGDIVGLATAVLWDASTRKEGFRRRKAKRRKLGHSRTQGAQGSPDKPTKTAVHVFCVSWELERVWFLVTKTVHRKCSPRGGAKISRCHRIAGSGRIGGEKDGNGSIPSTWSGCCPRSRSRCTAKENQRSVSGKRCRKLDCCGCC